MSTSTRPNPTQEAERLVALFDGPDLLGFLSGQLAVVKQQAQLLMGLCGLAITVTGFSGSHMIQAGKLSAAAMLVGIALILVGAVLCLRTLIGIRWVSEALGESLVETTLTIIAHRNAQQRSLSLAGIVVGCGLAAYLISVAIAALAHHA